MPGSDDCIRCTVEVMCKLGGADRIVLRTGRNVEVFSAAGRAVREVALIRRWSFSTEAPMTRCRNIGCPARRWGMM